MLSNRAWSAVAEVACIVLLSATIGVTWNRNLLLSAWRGEPAPQAVAPATAVQGAEEALPLPLGLLQVKEMKESGEAVLVDARDTRTYSEGHLPGAVSLPVAQAQQEAAAFQARVPKEKSIIVYCNGFSCHDSTDLGKKLIGWGYATVYVFEGGYPEWHDAGYPVERGRR